MNEIKVFENTAFGQVRTVVRNNEPWFVAADVCRALELVNIGNALARLDEDEKGSIRSMDGTSNGGNPNMSIVNEPGLYALVLGSRKPEAKAFKRWITHEVLPTLRQTGQYRMNEKAVAQSMRAEAMLRNAKSRQAALWVRFAGMVDEPAHKKLCASYGTEILAGHQVLPLPEVERTYSAAEVGQMFGISGQMVGRIANQNGLKTREYGRYVLDKSRHSSKEVETFRYNMKGAQAVGLYASGDK